MQKLAMIMHVLELLLSSLITQLYTATGDSILATCSWLYSYDSNLSDPSHLTDNILVFL